MVSGASPVPVSVPPPAPSARPRPRHDYLEVVGLDKRYRGARVLEGLDFRVGEGELVSLLGPSGCGKSTLLRIIAGLVRAEAGDVVVAGRNVSALPPHRRNVSVVFQSYALFPHLSVAENVAFGLRARRVESTAIAPRVSAALELVRMLDFAERPVVALSGGQQQRIAVARALVVEPNLLLLDEPFSALDRKLRETMQVELKGLLRERGITAVFVTHDQDEALAVSDRIAVMNAGRIEQFDEPSTLYARPASAFVMDFVGLSTRLAARATLAKDGRTTTSTSLGPLTVPGEHAVGAALTIGVRPELIEVADDANAAGCDAHRAQDRTRARVRVGDVMCLGSRTLLHCEPVDAAFRTESDRVICELGGIDDRLRRGAIIDLAWRTDDARVYVETSPS